MLVKEIPLRDIKIKDRARLDKGDIEGLAISIKEKGLIQPITVDQNMKLIAGERRFLAHEKLDAPLIPAIIRQVVDKVDALEIELIENTQRKDLVWHERAVLEKKIMAVQFAKNPNWTQDKQAIFTGQAVSSVNRRLKLAEALETLPDLADCPTEDEAFKVYKKIEEDVGVRLMLEKLPPHILKAVDRAAEHYLIGDAFAGMAKLGDGTFDFAEVDPPYGVDLDKRKSRNSTDTMEDYEEWDTDAYVSLFTKTSSEIFRLLKPNSFAVFWYGMSWHQQVLVTLRKVGFGVPDIPAIWYKGDQGQTASPHTTLGSCYEPFFLARKGQPQMPKAGRGNVFHFQALTKKIHPTEKPLNLLKEILSTTLDPGSNMIVPFLGSGVSLRAAYRLGHTGFGWDLSQEHKNGFLKRVEQDQKGNGETE